jgi:hypothetical protein
MPVRLVMNNKTLTIMEGVTFDKTVHIFNLEDSDLVQTQKSCFKVKDHSTGQNSYSFDMNFCPFGVGKSTEWSNEWDYDFNLFKYQCAVPRYNTTLDLNNSEEDELKNKVNQMKVDIIKEKEKKIISEQEDEEVYKRQKNLDNDELEVIAKEFDIEKLMEKEEREKELLEEDGMALELEKEKEKRDCLLKRIKQKEIENQYNLVRENDQKSLDEDKKEAQRLITIKRARMTAKLQQARERAERRKRKLENEIKTVRYEISEDVHNAYKKSHYECKFIPNDLKYCKSRNPTDPTEYGKCQEKSKDKESFCDYCCSKEIGSMYIDTRQICLDKCLGIEGVDSNNYPQKWFLGLDLHTYERKGVPA